MMHAYLIDPFTRTVTRVERSAKVGTPAELHEIYGLIGCDCIAAVNPQNAETDIIYVDDEGMLKEEGQQFFFCRLWPQEALAGRGLWIGTTPEGNDASPRCPLEYVRAHVVWLEQTSIGFVSLPPEA
jgi:hypothetical protein